MAIDYNMRAMVGPSNLFELIGAHQFCVMVRHGLRPQHKLLDVGCGCLRGGIFFIPYLDRAKYFGVEPNADLLSYGVMEELGSELNDRKLPRFYTFDDFRFAQSLPISMDYVLAQSIITHAGSDITHRIFRNAYNIIPAGKFIGTFFIGENDGRMGWLGNDIAQYSKEEIHNIARNAGFKSLEVRDYKHPMRQMWFIASKKQY